MILTMALFTKKSVGIVTESISDYNDTKNVVIVSIKELVNWNEEWRQTKMSKI